MFYNIEEIYITNNMEGKNIKMDPTNCHWTGYFYVYFNYSKKNCYVIYICISSCMDYAYIEINNIFQNSLSLKS